LANGRNCHSTGTAGAWIGGGNLGLARGGGKRRALGGGGHQVAKASTSVLCRYRDFLVDERLGFRFGDGAFTARGDVFRNAAADKNATDDGGHTNLETSVRGSKGYAYLRSNVQDGGCCAVQDGLEEAANKDQWVENKGGEKKGKNKCRGFRALTLLTALRKLTRKEVEVVTAKRGKLGVHRREEYVHMCHMAVM